MADFDFLFAIGGEFRLVLTYFLVEVEEAPLNEDESGETADGLGRGPHVTYRNLRPHGVFLDSSL